MNLTFFSGSMSPVDASQKKRSQLEIDREVLNQLAIAAILIDSNGLIQVFNKAASDLLGYSQMDVLGQNVKIIMAADAEKHDSYLANYKKNKKANIIGKSIFFLIFFELCIGK